MITLIVFFIGAILSYVLSVIIQLKNFALWEISLTYVFALAFILAVNAIAAVVFAKCLPKKCFNKDSKFYSPSKKECNFYEKIGIKKWKDKTLEFGQLNGFKKDKIENPKDPEYINKFILECNKGFMVHLISIIASVSIFFAVPSGYVLPMALPMFITSFIINHMSIMILRYNVPRLKTVLRFVERNKKS